MRATLGTARPRNNGPMPPPMPFHIALLPLAGFAGLILTAAVEDARRLVIPNRLTAGICLLWPFHLATGLSLAATVGAVGCAAAVFGFGALLFARGLVGGGDVKLLAAATLWAGPAATPSLLLGTAIAGGLLGLFLLTPLGRLATAWRKTDAAPVANPMPYGVAIAAAALFVTIPPYFG